LDKARKAETTLGSAAGTGCATAALAEFPHSNRLPRSRLSRRRFSGKKIILLKPRGFCAGVVRAIDVVKIALDLYGPPIYVRKEIVHNKHVVDELREAGAIFVEELEEVPRARA
jgi:hypothetical protein